MSSIRLGLATLTVALLTVACQRPADKEAAADAPAGSTTQTPATAEAQVPAGPISLVPATLDTCDAGAIVKVRWDIRSGNPEVSSIEIWTAPPTSDLTLFAAAGAAGEMDTGPWAGPGQIFAIRDKATGKELARAAVQGPECH